MIRIFNISLLAVLLTGSVAFGQITADPDQRQNSGREELKTTTPEGTKLPFAQRLRFGGGIGQLAFGNNITQIGIAPVVAYNATEHLILGVGVPYTYTRYKYGIPVTYIQIGVRGFAMYEVVPELVPHLYLHAEVESTNVSVKPDGYASSSSSYTAPLVGVTYMQPFSRRFGVNITVLYNLAYSSNQTGLSYNLYNGSPLVFRVAFY